MIKFRNILKIRILNEPILEQEKNILIDIFSKKHKCSREEAGFFIFSYKISNSTYNIEKSNIKPHTHMDSTTALAVVECGSGLLADP